MKDTYLDELGRECARLRYSTVGRYYKWREWVVSKGAGEWHAYSLTANRDVSARFLDELLHKLVKEYTPKRRTTPAPTLAIQQKRMA